MFRPKTVRCPTSPARRGGEPRFWVVALLACCNVMASYYHVVMSKQTTVRLPEQLADEAQTVARVRGTSMNQLIVESLRAEIDRVRADEEFTSLARRLLERDRELLERLAT